MTDSRSLLKKATITGSDKQPLFSLLGQEISGILRDMREFTKARKMRDIVHKSNVLKPGIINDRARPGISLLLGNKIQGSFIITSSTDRLAYATGKGSGLLFGVSRLSHALTKIRAYCINFDNVKGTPENHIRWRDFTELVEESAIFTSLIKALEIKADEFPLTDLAEQLRAAAYQWWRLKQCIENFF